MGIPRRVAFGPPIVPRYSIDISSDVRLAAREWARGSGLKLDRRYRGMVLLRIVDSSGGKGFLPSLPSCPSALGASGLRAKWHGPLRNWLHRGNEVADRKPARIVPRTGGCGLGPKRVNGSLHSDLTMIHFAS